jgi:hypothetical protein
VDIVSIIGGLVNNLLSKFFPDKTEQAKQAFILELQAQLGELELTKSQLAINQAEASNPNRTWATWRELAGYVCVCAITWAYVLQPLLLFLFAAAGHPIKESDLPKIELDQLILILGTMLGVGGLKTIEKVKGVKLHG